MSTNLNVKSSSASGSATGNPRNKTALKPGFSLVGWIRLGSSGEDLTGLKGKIINVSHQELAKHNKLEDCWMAVRGKVYNVTRYLDYHPGGVDQLMRGAGKDATSLFDEVHAWVNIDQLLAKCYVGPLRNTMTLSMNNSASSSSDLRTKLSPPASISALLKFPSILSVSSEALSKGSEKSESSAPSQIEVIPRFDWIQKTTELSIYFYTKSFCNPGIMVEKFSDKESEIKIIIANTSNSYKFSFLKALKWPCYIKVNIETGKIEFVFEKVVPELWSNFGIFERTRSKDETVYNEYSIETSEYFNDDSFELILRPKRHQLLIVPIGYHLNFRVSLPEKDVIRSYTPIPDKYSTKEAIKSTLDLHFLIKTYNVGTMSKYLSPNSSNDVIGTSQPKGNLDLSKIKSHTKIGMMAAGSGITPMISLIEHLLERNIARIETIILFFFNKKETDIWLREKFEELQLKEERFTIKHILSEPDASWPGETGRVSKQIVDQLSQSSSFIFVCGPQVFNEASMQLIEEGKVESHCFQG